MSEIPIARVMTFDSGEEWAEVMCELMCGSPEEDYEERNDGLVCDIEEDEHYG